MAERAAAASLAEQGYEPLDPSHILDELLDLGGRIRGHVEFFSAKVSALGDGMRYRSEHEQEQLRSEMALLERFIDRLHRVLTDLAKLGLEERRTRLEEADRERLVVVLVAAFDGLGLTSEQQGRVPSVLQAAIEATSSEAG